MPPLRAGVRLELAPDGTGALIDALFGRRIRLDPRGVVVCEALAHAEGTTALRALAAAAGGPAEAIAGFVARLTALDLVATPRAEVRAAERQALARVKAAPASHLLPLAGARFGCTMCGSCCGGHNVGPVADKILQGLEGDLAALAAEIAEVRYLDKELFVTLPPGERAAPGQDVMCHASGGSCVFLDDAGRCRIHARLGGDKKPLPCRIFPWELVATPAGVRVSVQRECRDFLAATGDDQPTLEEARGELAALLEALDELPTARPIPVLRGLELPSWAAWESFEQQLFAALERAGGSDPGATFRALVACLAPPSPDAARAATEASFPLWRARLLGPLTQMAKLAPAPSARLVIRVDALRIAIQALESGAGWVLARALAPLEPEGARLFERHLRHALWATTPLKASSVEAGLARLVAEWVLARLIAIVRAREVKRFHVTTQDLQDGLTVASFLFRHEDLQPILHELDGLSVAVFVDGLAAFLERAPALDPPDRRLELVKF